MEEESPSRRCTGSSGRKYMVGIHPHRIEQEQILLGPQTYQVFSWRGDADPACSVAMAVEVGGGQIG